MNINNTQNNQGYWFVLREDQSNVIFSSNNFTIHNPQITGQEAKYIVDTGDRQLIQIHETPVVSQEVVAEHVDSETKSDAHFWDRGKIKMLLTLCLENNVDSKNFDKTVLDEIAAHLGTTAVECHIKYRHLRCTFIRLLKKKRLGKQIKWVHYNICEKVFHDCKSLPSSVIEPWDDHKVRSLLNCYIENIGRFQSSECLQKDIWRDIATQVGTTQYNCYHKYKNLKKSYINWIQRNRETGKPVKWPYQQYFERIFYEYNPASGPWNKTKIRQLIDAYAQMADKFKNPRFQKKDLWKEISSIVGESPHSCDRKFRNLKQTYLKLRTKASSQGRLVTKWRYYKEFEAIYSPAQFEGICSPSQYWQNVPSRPQGDFIRQLLSFYVENKEKFMDPRVKKKLVWRSIASKMGMSSEECDRKFRNLKQTYVRLAEKRRLTGKTIKWPYYSYFEKIFGEPTVFRNRGQTDIIKRVILQEIQVKKDDDMFEKLVSAIEESNNIQRERNTILQALLDRR